MIRLNKQRGSVMVEFALILPVFVLLAVGGMLMLLGVSTYGNVGYIAQQVAQCRANYVLGGGGSPSSQCPGALGSGAATTYANTLGTAMNVNPGGNNFTVTETPVASCPGAGCIQEQVSYPYTPLIPLPGVPAFTMNQTATAAVTMYSGTFYGTNGIPVLAGTCASAPPITIPGVQPWMAATANPAGPEITGIVWNAYVDPNTPNQVDLNLCNITGAPTTTTSPSYNVRVIPG